jgi:hypothetical protein
MFTEKEKKSREFEGYKKVSKVNTKKVRIKTSRAEVLYETDDH